VIEQVARLCDKRGDSETSLHTRQHALLLQIVIIIGRSVLRPIMFGIAFTTLPLPDNAIM
jgi:hypothetical protein